MPFDTLALDKTGWHILEELQNDGRVSFAELGRRVGLTLPAVAERVRKMQDAGIITAFRAEVNPAKIGLPIAAFIRISVVGDVHTYKFSEAVEDKVVLDLLYGPAYHRLLQSHLPLSDRFARAVVDMPEVLECHRGTGADSFTLKVAVESVQHLERLIDKLTPFGTTSTSIILSTLVKKRDFTSRETTRKKS